MRYERWVQHNLIRHEGRLPALRELTHRRRLRKPLLYPLNYGGSRRSVAAPRGEKASVGEVASYCVRARRSY